MEWLVLISRCVFVAVDFMLDQAKAIAASTVSTLKECTACYGASWSIRGNQLIREEVCFVGCILNRSIAWTHTLPSTTHIDTKINRCTR